MGVNDSQEQDNFTGKLRARFDASVENLDADTVARIRRVRYQALEQAGRRRPALVWLPAGAIAAVCLAVIIYGLLPGETTQPPEAAPVLEQMELISELELYEDLEFYLWLEEHELPT